MDHVEHLVEVGGIDSVAFGGDFVSCDGPRPGREALFHDPRKEPPVLPGLTEAHEMHTLTGALLERGFGEADVAAVLGGNLLRVLGRVLPKDWPRQGPPSALGARAVRRSVSEEGER